MLTNALILPMYCNIYYFSFERTTHTNNDDKSTSANDRDVFMMQPNTTFRYVKV